MPPGDTPELFPPQPGDAPAPAAPLADRMRPRHLDEVVGQARLLAPGAGLRTLADTGALPSLILWGPPGCGKTTLARLLAPPADFDFAPLTAVSPAGPWHQKVPLKSSILFT